MGYLRLYDENLEIVCELKRSEVNRDGRLKTLLEKSQLFLQVDNLYCYRVMDVFKSSPDYFEKIIYKEESHS